MLSSLFRQGETNEDVTRRREDLKGDAGPEG